jgi:hypothetical protein
VQNLRGRDSGGSASLAYRFLQRLAGQKLADPDNVAGPRGSRGQQLRFITNRARGFGTAAVDTEVEGHGYF